MLSAIIVNLRAYVNVITKYIILFRFESDT
jgi:hypothetical protein